MNVAKYNLGFLGSPRELDAESKCRLYVALNDALRAVHTRRPATALHIGLQKGAGLYAAAYAMSNKIPFTAYEPRYRHSVGNNFAVARHYADEVRSKRPCEAPINGDLFRTFALHVIQSSHVLVLMLRHTGPSTVYTKLALESGKPLYVIDLDTWRADWVARPYTPTSADEGAWFERTYCDTCATQPLCTLMDDLVLHASEPMLQEHPSEFINTDRPQCTAYDRTQP